MSEQSPRARGDLSAAVAARSPDVLLRAVREATAGTYDVLDEMGRDQGNAPVFLARDLRRGELIALRLRTTAGVGALEEIRQLDASIPSISSPCPNCSAPVSGWLHRCGRCGADVSGVAPGTDPGRSAAELLGALHQLAGAQYEVLGSIPRASGGAPAYFARQRNTGRLATLRLLLAPGAAAGSSDYALGVTQVGIASGSNAPTMVGESPIGEATLIEAPPPRAGAPRSPAAPPAAAPAQPVSSPAPPPIPPAAAPGRAGAAGGSTELKRCPRCNEEFPATTRFCPNDGSTLVSQKTGTDLVGQVLAGRYEIQRLIGEGGMGRVYLAEQLRMGRRCALKVMHPALSHDADAAGRFTREAHNASRITHPHVAAIYDFGEAEDGFLYIAMEFVDGEPLSSILARERRLPVERATAIARQVAEALDAAHELGIVHRDLKPDNIMIARGRNGRDQVKVVDFGIAKAIQRGQQQLTKTGFIVGTPAYMSIEQITGSHVDGRSDIYSLGCILYEMLTGQRTFAGPDGDVVLTRRLAEPPPHPRQLDPSIPRAVDEAVHRALARDPAERYATASEFADALSVPHETPSARRWLANLLRMPTKPSASAPTPATPATPVTPQAPAAGAAPVAPLTPPGSPSPLDSPPLARRKIRWQLSSPGMPAMKPDVGSPPSGSGAAPDRPPVGAPVVGQPSPASPWAAPVAPEPQQRTPVRAASAQPSADTPNVSPTPAPWANLRLPEIGPELSRQLMWTGGAVVGGALLLFVVLRSPKRDATTTPARPTQPPVVASQPASPQPTIPVAPRPETSAVSPSSSGTPATGPVSDITARAQSELRRALLAATSMHGRATRDGASVTELAAGDSLLASADRLAQQGQYAKATADAWDARDALERASRSARDRAVAKSANRPSDPPTPRRPDVPAAPQPPVVASQKPAPSNPPVTLTRPSAPPAAPINPAAVASQEVRSAVNEYVLALSQRKLDEMRRLWPGMPPDASKRWEGLFREATEFSATIVSIEDPVFSGTTAQTTFGFSLSGYVPSQGRLPKSTLRFRTSLARNESGWHMVTLEPIH